MWYVWCVGKAVVQEASSVAAGWLSVLRRHYIVGCRGREMPGHQQRQQFAFNFADACVQDPPGAAQRRALHSKSYAHRYVPCASVALEPHCSSSLLLGCCEPPPDCREEQLEGHKLWNPHVFQHVDMLSAHPARLQSAMAATSRRGGGRRRRRACGRLPWSFHERLWLLPGIANWHRCGHVHISHIHYCARHCDLSRTELAMMDVR